MTAEEQRQQALEEFAPQIMAMAQGTLAGVKGQQAGLPILAFVCQCGARFGSGGHEARVVHCPFCHALWKVEVKDG